MPHDEHFDKGKILFPASIYYTIMANTDASGGSQANQQHWDKATNTIESLSTKLNISDETRKFTEQLYKQLLNETEIVNIKKTTAACIYLATKLNETPLTGQQIATASDEYITDDMILRHAKQLASELDIATTVFINIEPYIKQFGEEVNASDKVLHRALEINTVTTDHGVNVGKSPSGWAAAALYLAAREHDSNITQQDISQASGVSEVTIRNLYQEQQNVLQQSTTTPSDPEKLINWYADRIDIPQEIQSQAKELVVLAQEHNYSITESPVWAIAALRKVSEDHNDTISMRSLRTPFDISSEKIYEYRNKLRRLN